MGYKVLHKIDNKNYIWRPSEGVYKIYFDGITPTPTPTGGDSCPAPWMKILLSNGEKIQAGNLKVGMKVKTYHENTMEYGDYIVSYVKTLICKRILLKFDHTDFICSESHKFYLHNTWIKAKDLKAGNIISGHELKEITDYDNGEVVKITVDDAHTYICEGLLSHNKTYPTVTATPTATSPVATATPTATPTPTPTATPTPTPTATPVICSAIGVNWTCEEGGQWIVQLGWPECDFYSGYACGGTQDYCADCVAKNPNTDGLVCPPGGATVTYPCTNR